MVRTHLLPGILETFANNRDYGLPQRIFEIGDVSILDEHAETGAWNSGKLPEESLGLKQDLLISVQL